MYNSCRIQKIKSNRFYKNYISKINNENIKKELTFHVRLKIKLHTQSKF